ncbi:hypothetical protein MCETE7_00082 [Acidimicrobiia bacterium]
MTSAESLVVVLPDSDVLGGQVQTLARTWSSVGLLGPSFWITELNEVEQARGELIYPGRANSVTRLVNALAEHAFEQITFVALRLVTHDEAIDSLTASNDAERTAVFINEQLAQGFQTLERINLIVPVTRLDRVPPDLVMPMWNANVVVAAEDRISSAHADGMVEVAARYVEHALLALATNSGLWVGLDGPGAKLHSNTTQGTPTVRVTRSFARGLFGDDVIGSITNGVADGFAKPELPATWAGVEADEHPGIAVDEMVRQYIEDPKAPLRFHNPRWKKIAQQEKIGPWEAISKLTRFIVQHIAGTPDRVLRYIKEDLQKRTENFVQTLTFGDDSIMRVKIGAGPIGELDPVEVPDAAGEVLRRLGIRPGPAMPPDGWNVVQRAVLRLVDPANTDDSTSRVVLDRSYVVSDADFLPVFNGDGDLRLPDALRDRFGVEEHPCSPRVARLVQADLDDFRTLCLPPPPLPHADDESVDEPTAVADGLIDPEMIPVDPSDETAVEEIDAVFDPESPSPTEPDELVSLYESTQESFEEWVKGRNGSAAWKLGEHLDAACVQSSKVFSETLKIVRTRPSDAGWADMEKRTWKWIKNSVFITIVAIALAVLAAIIFAIFFFIALPVLLVIWAVMNLRKIRELFRAQYRMDAEWEKYLAALDVLPRQAAEVVRLESAYFQYLDWTLILGELVEPRNSAWPPTEVLNIDSMLRPAAAVFVLAEMNGIGRAGAVSRVGRRVFKSGWLETFYFDAIGSARDSVAAELGLEPTSVELTPFHGVHRERLRLALMEELATGRTVEQWRERAGEDVSRTVSAESFSELFPEVVAGGSTIASTEFFASIKPRESGSGGESFGLTIWSAEGLADRSLSVKETLVSGPTVLVETADGADYAAVMARIDISAEVLIDRIRLFSGRATVERVSETIDITGIG